MSGSAVLEYRKDFLNSGLYASRNSNDLQHTYAASGANRSQVAWNLTLRQSRRPQKAMQSSNSEPMLATLDRAQQQEDTGSRRKARDDHIPPEHVDGPYHGSTKTVGKYQNYGETHHMLDKLARVSSGNPISVDWQLNLRGGLHGEKGPPIIRDESVKSPWRRYHTRPQQTFDMLKENCAKDNILYKECLVTPEERRPDRWMGSVCLSTNRDDPISFRRMAGCEGTQVGQWEHLLKDYSRGHKQKRQMAHETTLREYKGDGNGAKISDQRSDGCIVEMLGKKQWSNHGSHDTFCARAPKGDYKLHHLSGLRTLSEPNEMTRKARRSKQQRHESEQVEVHEGRFRRSEGDSDV